MDNAIYLLLGAALTWAFYFVQRRVERRHSVDAIARHRQLLELKQGLEGAHTSLEELRRFEAQLIGKAEAAARRADAYVDQVRRVARAGRRGGLDEADMNRRAAASYRRMDARLAALVARLRTELDAPGLAAFEAVHAGWLDYRERYARFIADAYSTGAIQPLIRAVTAESLTAAWITELETQLGEAAEDGDTDDRDGEPAGAAAPAPPG